MGRGAGRRPVTGGGLVGLLDPEQGLVGLWVEDGPVVEALELTVAGRAAPPSEEMRVAHGAWDRELALADGLVLRERGLLPDTCAAAVVQWSVEGNGPLRLEMRLGSPASGRSPGRLELDLAAGSTATVAILPSGSAPSRVQALLRPLRARELQRLDRAAVPGVPPSRLLLDGRSVPGVEASGRLLDDAPLHGDPAGLRGPFLAGIRGGRPSFLAGAAVSELGLAALATGRHALGLACFESLVREATPPAVPLVHLAAQLALWTGSPELVRPHEDVLDNAIRQAERASGSEPAAFPSLARALDRLIDGIEPEGGGGWIEALRERAKRLRTAPAGRRLPVVGADPQDEPVPPESFRDSILPAPESFSPPDAPAFRSRSTLQAARILRAWVEGRFGAHPDAAYGRVRLAPDLGAFPASSLRAELSGLRVGDATVDLDCRWQGDSVLVELRQNAGRVPLNLVFEPLLPFARIDDVHIGQEVAQVETERLEGRTRIHCQFPLDPVRTIRIGGSR